ncbi:hypothetical protein DRE_04658 [Drechslerella stenobrocha 248]|uniref:Uncharacterized protein n=1 Tax=Drechslerella stenobrocha 248 TaxID=1043628 RepID=W7HSA5_9PEZI|nr:hypothetical protein DRE_04658 [Drechslerella stenobrocha 248]
MNKIATPLLYEMINIMTNDEYQWEERQVRCLTELPNRNLKLIKQLLNFCVRPANTKECMKLIERMDKDQLQCIELFQKGEHGDGCKEVVEVMFRENQRFRAMYVDMDEQNLYDTFFPLISASSNCLTTLILVIEKKESFLYNLDALLSFLKSLRYLRSFELDMVEYFEDSPWYSDEGVRLIDSVFALPTIEQLVFGGSDFPYDLYHDRHPGKRIGGNLTQFGFFSSVSCDNFLLNNFDPSRLRALRILWPVETDFEVLATFMQSFKGLRSLHLTLRNPDAFDNLRCISHHGETLERLSLRVFTPSDRPFARFQHSHEDFEQLLQKCTALRELAVPLMYLHQPMEAWCYHDDILRNNLDWRFRWPNTVSPIESLHVLNEPLPGDNAMRSYHKTRRRHVITRFARAFHAQLNIRGISDMLDWQRYPVDTVLDNQDTDTADGIHVIDPHGGDGCGPPLLPNLRALLFGDNTKCGRDSCLYLHDWEFEEMDLVPVVVDRVDVGSGAWEGEGDEWIAADCGDRVCTRVRGGAEWQYKEVGWAEFVGRFPWLHDFEIDARGWMDERTRIENRDKFRFWE